MSLLIYADHAATTKLDSEAFEAMKTFLINDYGNASQPYSFSRSSKKALKEARIKIANCINAEPEEIYFTSGGSESDNWAIKGTAFVYGDNRTVITSQIEHHAILNACEAVERMGYPVAYLSVNEKGVILPETLKRVISSSTKLVSIMYANNEIGSIQPISELCEIAHKQGVLFHTDAVQAVGHIPIDVKKLNIDMLSASAHKFNGPKGIGFLYLKNGTKLQALIDGGSQEKYKRAGTENIASIVGMAVALENNCKNMKKNIEWLNHLEKIFLENLSKTEISFIKNGSDNCLPGNISVSFKNSNGEMILHRLDLMGICISTGSACNSQETKISHVLSAIHVPDEYIQGTIRISLGHENTEEDVIKIVNCIDKILKR